jgi:Ca2+-binding RTX toxin-like protein
VPTIVGVPGEVIEGTDGPDVVVTNGAGLVATGAGDDLVCVIGQFQKGFNILDTGSGNDRIDASAANPAYATFLGGGVDEYIGGPASDRVYDNYYGEPDLIRTAGGPDFVATVGGAHVVDLGAGRDRLLLHGDPSAEAVVTGGAGSDSLGIKVMGSLGTHSWKVDSGAEMLLRDGDLEASWDSFDRFEIAARGPFAFVGSDLDETLILEKQYATDLPAPTGACTLEYHWRPSWPQDVRMRGGDDTVTFFGGANGNRFDGGQGADKFRYLRGRDDIHTARRGPVGIDLSRGVVWDTTASATQTSEVVSFENATVGNPLGRAILKGSDGPNTLKGISRSGVTIDGRSADDVLFGGCGQDALIGGSGDDTADGGPGRDRCEAEVESNCEQ